jgi:hypothetical protein
LVIWRPSISSTSSVQNSMYSTQIMYIWNSNIS